MRAIWKPERCQAFRVFVMDIIAVAQTLMEANTSQLQLLDIVYLHSKKRTPFSRRPFFLLPFQALRSIFIRCLICICSLLIKRKCLHKILQAITCRLVVQCCVRITHRAVRNGKIADRSCLRCTEIMQIGVLVVPVLTYPHTPPT